MYSLILHYLRGFFNNGTGDGSLFHFEKWNGEPPPVPFVLSYDDGAKPVLLYPHKSKVNISEELRQFLLYFEQTTDEHAVNDTLLRIHEMIKAVKHSEEVQDKYMKTWEWEDKIRAEGREEGQREKRIHTQQERDRAEQEIVRLRKELEQLKKQLS